MASPDDTIPLASCQKLNLPYQNNGFLKWSRQSDHKSDAWSSSCSRRCNPECGRLQDDLGAWHYPVSALLQHVPLHQWNCFRRNDRLGTHQHPHRHSIKHQVILSHLRSQPACQFFQSHRSQEIHQCQIIWWVGYSPNLELSGLDSEFPNTGWRRF